MTPSTTMLSTATARMGEQAATASTTSTSWLNFDLAAADINTTTPTNILKDSYSLAGECQPLPSDEFMELSELDNSYRELESIPEVTDDEVGAVSSSLNINNDDIELLKQSVLAEMFPGDIDMADAKPLALGDSVQLTEFEANDLLCKEVEKYLEAATGEATSVVNNTNNTEDLLAKSWELSDIPSPGSFSLTQPADAGSSEVFGEQQRVTVATSVEEVDSIFDALTSGAVMFDPSSGDDDGNEAENTYSLLDADGSRIQIIIVPAVESATTSSSSLQAPPPAPVSPLITTLNISNDSALSPAAASSVGAWSPRSAVASSSSSSYEDDESDEDWKPELGSVSPARRQEPTTSTARPRKKYERRVPRCRPDLVPYPKDKVDRKKAQNRTAAWKYREKKKAEQDLVDLELNNLMSRNAELKKHLGNLELQMNCLKQLMAEAGMGPLMANI